MVGVVGVGGAGVGGMRRWGRNLRGLLWLGGAGAGVVARDPPQWAWTGRCCCKTGRCHVFGAGGPCALPVLSRGSTTAHTPCIQCSPLASKCVPCLLTRLCHSDPALHTSGCFSCAGMAAVVNKSQTVGLGCIGRIAEKLHRQRCLTVPVFNWRCVFGIWTSRRLPLGLLGAFDHAGQQGRAGQQPTDCDCNCDFDRRSGSGRPGAGVVCEMLDGAECVVWMEASGPQISRAPPFRRGPSRISQHKNTKAGCYDEGGGAGEEAGDAMRCRPPPHQGPPPDSIS